ncbi:FCS-Like Zinc finger 10 isoform X2 [Cicer arietinum]|uniref:FCS-Like Zinc finger 10 isoform X2 n=1 Tax=Cicer arietinum TaxID=3827 RepID=UPI003CC518C6
MFITARILHLGFSLIEKNSESAWSPTSPLDYKLFSNLSNVFSAKSSRPSYQTGHKKQFDGSKVGLGIITSLVNEAKLNNEILGKFPRKNIILRSQVKKNGILKFSKNNHESLASCLKSNSLPKNYVISTESPKSEVESFDDIGRESKGLRGIVASLSDSSRPSSLINLNQNLNLGTDDLFVEDTSTVSSLPPVTKGSSLVDNSLKITASSLPISIDFSNGYVGSLSAKEIELSEDYTCIISHGPNPKRTHIFGDCILECHNNDFTEFCMKEDPPFRSSQVPMFSEESVPHHFDNVTSFCHSCNKKLDQGSEDIYDYSGEKAFCSFKCQSEEILAEDEMEKTFTNSEESSPNSSYHDLFLMQVSK